MDYSHYSASTLAVHGDDPLNDSTDVAPAMHVSTTYRYPEDPDKLVPFSMDDVMAGRDPLKPGSGSDPLIYSREAAPNTSRLETILSHLLKGPALTYSSGLAAFHALLVALNPKVVAIGDGYHGCHGVLKIFQKLTQCKIVDVHNPDTWEGLGEGDVVHLETPLNPTGEAYEIERYAKWAHERGAVLTVDATFAPPPLMDPFACGADFVMHSGTKYFGGHSDMLCGVVAINPARPNATKEYWGMWDERVCLGAVMGSLEGWLGVRSIRTLELRVQRQSETTTALVQWLVSLQAGEGPKEDVAVVQKALSRVQHASLQKDDMHWLKKQMPGGYGPVFAIWMAEEKFARRLPSKLALFHHATSLGGVESLIEWRRMSDAKIDSRVLRVSIGVENVEDLKKDLLAAFKAVLNDA
ncbi:cystathionine beta-lyase, partial [Aureobasidium melanogenum]